MQFITIYILYCEKPHDFREQKMALKPYKSRV